MTLLTQENVALYDGLLGQDTFPYTFQVNNEDDMVVSVDNVTITPGEFTMTGVGSSAGGNVILNTPLIADAPVKLVRVVPLTQEVDYTPFDAFPSETHEGALDKLTMITQQLNEGLTSLTINIPADEIGLTNNTTPTIEFRKGKVLGFDEFGNVTVLAGVGDAVFTLVTANPDSTSMIRVDNVTNGARFPLIGVQPPNVPDALLQLNSNGGIPDSVLAVSPIVQAVDVNEVNSALMLTITTTDGLADLSVNTPNLPDALLQLDEFGQIPADLLQYQGLRTLGVFRGDDLCDKPGDLPGDCTPPDFRNPTERFPELDPIPIPDPVPPGYFLAGDMFAITFGGGETTGSINLFLEIGDAAPQLVPVFDVDGIIYLTEIVDPNDPGNILVQEGWYYQKNRYNLTTADLVAFDPLGNIYAIGDNVQTAINQLDAQAVLNQAQSDANLDLAATKPITGGLILESALPRITFKSDFIGDGAQWDMRVNNADGTYSIRSFLEDLSASSYQYIFSSTGSLIVAQLNISDVNPAGPSFAVRKDYSDAADAQVLVDANIYTDAAVTGLTTIAYVDGGDATSVATAAADATTKADAAEAAAVVTANAYTDAQLTPHTDQSVQYGVVAADGTAIDMPAGWTVSSSGAGVYVIVHGLTLATVDNQSVVTSIDRDSTADLSVYVSTKTVDGFTINVRQGTNNSARPFNFIWMGR